jgi:hypothetical protein
MPRSQVGRSPWSRIQSWSWLSSNWGGQTALVFALTNNCEEAMMIPGPGGGKGNSMEFCLILFGSEWLGICRIMSDPKCTTRTPLQKAFPWWPGTCMTCAFRLLKIDMKINDFFLKIRTLVFSHFSQDSKCTGGRQHSLHNVTSRPWTHRWSEKILSYEKPHWLQTANATLVEYESGLLSRFYSTTLCPSIPAPLCQCNRWWKYWKRELQKQITRYGMWMHVNALRLKAIFFHGRVKMLLKL